MAAIVAIPANWRLRHLQTTTIIRQRQRGKIDLAKQHPCNVKKRDLNCFLELQTELPSNNRVTNDNLDRPRYYLLEKSCGTDGKRRFIKKTYPVQFPKPSTGWKVHQGPFRPESLGKNPFCVPYPDNSRSPFRAEWRQKVQRKRNAPGTTTFWKAKWKKDEYDKALQYYSDQKQAYIEAFWHDLQFSPDLEDR